MQQTSKLINALVLFACMTLTVSACQTPTCRSRFLIPQGYVGWVVIYYNIKDAPPPVNEDERELFRISAQGRAETRSRDVAPCYMNSDYYFVATDGTRQPLEKTPNGEYKLILREASGYYSPKVNGGDQSYLMIFVGTQEQYEQKIDEKFEVRRRQDIN